MTRDRYMTLEPDSDIPVMDETMGERTFPKGDNGFMYLTADSLKEKPASERHPGVSSSENQAKRNLVGRCQLESILYRLCKAVLMFAALALISIAWDLYTGTWNRPLIMAALLLMYPVVAIRMPSQKLVPLRRKRADSGSFLSNEIKLMMLVICAAFFSGIDIPGHALAAFLAVNFVLQTGIFLAWRRYNLSSSRAQNFRPATRSEKKVIIFGAGRRGKSAADIFLKYPDLNVRVLGFIDLHKTGLWRYRDIPLLGHSDRIVDIVNCNQVDAIVMAPEPKDYPESQRIFNLAEAMGVDICVLPFIYERKISTCYASSVNGQPMLLYRPLKRNPDRELMKNIMDKIGALVGLMVASPILLLSALAIKLDSCGPVFFRQRRSGKNGRVFDMLKLRTMVNNADGQKEKLKHLNMMSGPVFKIKDDPRVTRVGKILRKFSIDEFPQFINVLKGDMSLVGPRPPLPSEVAQYEPWQRRKLSVKPGATCLWQINGRNHIDFEKWTRLDLQYIDEWSLKEDARILLKTVPAVLKGNGAS